MDDDKLNPQKNQSQPPQSEPNQPQPTAEKPQVIFETVPQEEKAPPEVPNIKLEPEEVPSELESPQDLATEAPPPSPPSGETPPPFIEEKRNKYLFIGGGALVFLFIFVLILKLVFGSGGGNKEVNLTYWGLWEEKTVMQPLIDQYQAKNKNVKITYQKMSPQSYREKIVARSQNNQGPDIFRFHNTWVPEIKEVLAPLPSAVMSTTEFEKTFYPVYKQDLKIENNYYGIPLMLDGLVLVYNNNLFKRAGITNPPVSWEDVIDYVTKLTVKNKDGQIVTAGIALGTTSNVDHFSDIFGLFLAQNGASIKNLTTVEAAGALEGYRKFAEAPDNFWDDSLPPSTTAFAQEKVAMIIVPSWEILTIKAANPEIELKVVPIPSIPGSKPVSISSYWVEGVSRLSKNQTEAWKFLKYLSERENMSRLYELQSQSRLFGEAYSRIDLGDTLAQNEYLGAVIKQADTFVSVPTISHTFDNGLNDEINVYIENAINQTAQGVSYEEALQTANQGVTQVFAKYHIQ